MQELEITWWRLVRIVWLIIWRATLGAVVVGFSGGGNAGFVIGVIEGAMGASREEVISASKVAGSVAGALVGLTCTLVAVRMALRKRYSDFRLALLPHAKNVP